MQGFIRTKETLEKYHLLEDLERKFSTYRLENIEEYDQSNLWKWESIINTLSKDEFRDYFNFYKYGL